MIVSIEDFIYAAARGQVDKLKQYVDNGVDINKAGGHAKAPALYYAIRYKQANAVKYLLAQPQISLTYRKNIAYNYLEIAMIEGNKHIVNCLLDAGLELKHVCFLMAYRGEYNSLQKQWLSYVDSSGNGLLHYAVANGQLNTVRWLVKHGANIHRKNIVGYTPLLLSAKYGHLKIMQWLAGVGSSIDEKNTKEETPLLLSARGGYLKSIQWLVVNGASIAEKDKYSFTPLLNTIFYGQFKAAQWLLANGASLEEKTVGDYTPLLIAADCGNLEILQWLVERGAALDEKSQSGETPLLCAAQFGNIEIVQWLLERGASLNEKDNDGNTALLLAASRGRLEIVQLLLERGASLHDKDKNSKSIFLIALQHDHLYMLHWLLEYAVRLDEVNFYNDIALLSSVHDGGLDTLKFLLEKSVNLDTKNSHGYTPLMMAAISGQLKTLRWLLDNGASASEENSQGMTPLLLAAENGQLEIVKWLMEQVLSTVEKDSQVNKARFCAASNDHLEITQYLLKHDAYMNHIDNRNIRALFMSENNTQWQKKKALLYYYGGRKFLAMRLVSKCSWLDILKFMLPGLSKQLILDAFIVAARNGNIKVGQFLLNNCAQLTEVDDNLSNDLMRLSGHVRCEKGYAASFLRASLPVNLLTEKFLLLYQKAEANYGKQPYPAWKWQRRGDNYRLGTNGYTVDLIKSQACYEFARQKFITEWQRIQHFKAFQSSSYSTKTHAHDVLAAVDENTENEILEHAATIYITSKNSNLNPEDFQGPQTVLAQRWYDLGIQHSSTILLNELYQKQPGVVALNKQHLYAWACFNQAIACSPGHADSHYRLGLLYHFGSGVRQDYLKAREHYKQAAHYYSEAPKTQHKTKMLQLCRLAMYRLGVKELTVAGNTVDSKILEDIGTNLLMVEHPGLNPTYFQGSQSIFAQRCYDQGTQYFSTVLLSELYEQQRGTTKLNETHLRAWACFNQAIAYLPNHADSHYKLGLLYHVGSGIRQDYLKAREHYKQAVHYYSKNPKTLYKTRMHKLCRIAMRRLDRDEVLRIVTTHGDINHIYNTSSGAATLLTLSLESGYFKNAARLILMGANHRSGPNNIIHPINEAAMKNLLYTKEMKLQQQMATLSTILDTLVGKPHDILCRFVRTVGTGHDIFSSRETFKILENLFVDEPQNYLLPLLELAKLTTLGIHDTSGHTKSQQPNNYDSDDDYDSIHTKHQFHLTLDATSADVNAKMGTFLPPAKPSTRGVFVHSAGNPTQAREHHFNNIYVAQKGRSVELNRGTLIHELTHFIAYEVFKNGCIPYAQNDVETQARYKAIVDDLKHRTKRVVDSTGNRKPSLLSQQCRVSDAGGNYSRGCFNILSAVFRNYDEDKYEAEVIVRVPQILATYGEAGLEWLLEHANALFGYYLQCFLPSVNEHIEKLKYRATQGWPIEKMIDTSGVSASASIEIDNGDEESLLGPQSLYEPPVPINRTLWHVKFSTLTQEELEALHKTPDDRKSWDEKIALFKQVQAGKNVSTEAMKSLIIYFEVCRNDFSTKITGDSAFKKVLALVEQALSFLNSISENASDIAIMYKSQNLI